MILDPFIEYLTAVFYDIVVITTENNIVNVFCLVPSLKYTLYTQF